MNRFAKLYELTEQLYQCVENPPKKEEREDYIEKLTQLIEERGLLIENIDRNPSENEKLLLKKSIDRNEQMGPRLQSELNSVKRDMLNLKQKKETGRRYENPYAHEPVDGAFIDKRN